MAKNRTNKEATENKEVAEVETPVVETETTEKVETPETEVEVPETEKETPVVEDSKGVKKITLTENIMFREGLQKKGSTIEVTTEELKTIPKKWYK